MRLPSVRFTVRGMMIAVASIVVSFALTDMLRNHRRVVQLRAAWAYDVQDQDCVRLALAHTREAARERQEAARWPAGSPQRDSHLRAAAFEATSAAQTSQVGGAARRMASELRRVARVSK